MKKTLVEFHAKYRVDSKLPGPDVQYFATISEQRLTSYWFAKLYHFYDMRIFKVPGFASLEKFDVWLHSRRCNDDCMTGEVWRRATDVTTVETYCAHMPIDTRQDFRCCYLSDKNKTRIAEFPLSEPEYNRLRALKPSARELTALLG